MKLEASFAYRDVVAMVERSSWEDAEVVSEAWWGASWAQAGDAQPLFCTAPPPLHLQLCVEGSDVLGRAKPFRRLCCSCISEAILKCPASKLLE